MLSDFKYCPLCQHELKEKHLFGRVRQYCPQCGYVRFRDPKLAAGALIVHNERVLLIRRGVIPRIGYWALPSGFVEYDEQPRPALQREVAEETGLHVEVGRILDIFPLSDPRKQGVFLLFEARYVGGQLQAGDDVSEVRWFTWDEIPWSELAFPQMRAWLAAALRPDAVAGSVADEEAPAP